MKNKYKILIVDDESTMIHEAEKMISNDGYEVSIARNGKEGLTKATTESPDLILLDILMPDMNGIDLAKSLAKK